MAKYQFTDSAGRTAWKDDSGNVYTEGGNNPTYMNVNQWNQRQQNKYGGGGGSWGSSYTSSFTPSTNFGQNFQNISGIYNQYGNPVIDALKRAEGDMGKYFDEGISALKGKEKPMKERYANLINMLKTNQGVAEKRQETATTSELGRRGISMDSGVAQNLLTEQVNPITESYTGQIKDLGLTGEEALMDLAYQIANLTGQRAQTIGDYASQIGEQQMSSLENALTMANTLGTGAQSAYEFGVNAAQKEKENAELLEAQKNLVNLLGLLGINVPTYTGTTGQQSTNTGGNLWSRAIMPGVRVDPATLYNQLYNQ